MSIAQHDTSSTPPCSLVRVVSRQDHSIAQVRMGSAVIGRVQQGRKFLQQGPHSHTVATGDLFYLPAHSEWTVRNQPSATAAFRSIMLVLNPDVRAAWLTLRPQQTELVPALGKPLNETHGGVWRDALSIELFERAVSAQEDAHLPVALKQHRLHEFLLCVQGLGLVLSDTQSMSWDQRVGQLLASDPGREWLQADVAAGFHVSVATLRRRLSETGSSFAHLLQEVRMQQGLTLLQTQQGGVADVAFRMGYRSASRFAAAFKRRYGLSPGQVL